MKKPTFEAFPVCHFSLALPVVSLFSGFHNYAPSCGLLQSVYSQEADKKVLFSSLFSKWDSSFSYLYYFIHDARMNDVDSLVLVHNFEI